jgi:hypothetical protein
MSLAIAMMAACGGNGSDGSSPMPAATGAQPCQILDQAKSFRYVSKTTLESPDTTETPTADLPLPSPTRSPRAFDGYFLYEYEVEASVVSPDRFHFTISATDAPRSDIIIIGEEVWQQLEGVWTALPLAAGIPYQPIPVCEAILPELDLSQGEPQQEEVNGRQTMHYTFPKNPSPQGVATIFGENSDMAAVIKELDVDLWLSAEEGELVRLELRGKGLYSDGRPLVVHLELDVRDINADDIKIEPPI